MAGPLYFNRVMEASLTEGTGPYAFSGIDIPGYQPWGDRMSDGDTAYYGAESVDDNNVPDGGWEVGLGTYDATNNRLARTTILESSNSDAVVNWGSGTKRIALVLPASLGVTNALLAQMAQATVKGRASGAGTGAPTDLTAAEVTAILNEFTSLLKGLVPASGGGTSNFLRADGAFAVPPGTATGTVTTTGTPASGNLAKFTGPTSVSNGNLSGDATTTDTLVLTIANDAVTYAKMQNVSAASRLLGRGSAGGAGDVQELTIGQGLGLSGTDLTGLVFAASVTLTDAQIKALPTTGVQVLAAPVSGYRPKPIGGSLYVNANAGIYTNINTTYSDFHIETGAGQYMAYGPVNDNTVTPALTGVSDLFGSTAVRVMDLPMPFLQYDGGYIVTSSLIPASGVVAQQWLVKIDNNGSGNFTGGNAANSGKVTVYYVLEATP